MRPKFLTASVAVILLGGGCASAPVATVEKSSESYQNTFDFVWEAALDELKIAWRIEKEDRAARTITTAWNVNLSPFSGKGRRDRLVVSLVGDPRSGWRASAAQESEANANEKNPLDPAEAKWEEVQNDGGLAARFLQNLDTRLQPDERWRDRLAR